MASWEPTFVSVVGGSGIERAALVRGLIGALRSRGTTATSLQGDGARFWEMALVFVEGFAASTIPRIVLVAPGELLPRHAFTGGDVIAVVDPAASGDQPEPFSSVLDGIAQQLCARMPGGAQGNADSHLETDRAHEIEGVALRHDARP